MPLAPTERTNAYEYDATTGLFGTVSNGTSTFTNSYETTRDAFSTKVISRINDWSVISSIDYTVNSLGQRTNATRSGVAANHIWTEKITSVSSTDRISPVKPAPGPCLASLFLRSRITFG